MTIHEQIATLIYKYVTVEISSDEKATLDRWLAESDQNRAFFHEVMNSTDLLEELAERHRIVTDEDQERAWQKMVAIGAVPSIAKVIKPRWTWWRYSVAVAVFLCVVLVSFIIFFNPKPVSNTPLTEVKPVTPGSSKATLTLSDGRKISLDSASSSILAMQGDVKVENKDGRLTYVAGGTQKGEIIYNTLSTAKGQIYATVLSDGSKVWLNSASLIRYPVGFYGDDRAVEIQGEAFFEVAHNRQKPFKVSVNGSRVEVTGTSFNIQAYSDETIIKTTLLEGGVTIYPHPSGSDLFRVLKPGQQAQIGEDKSVIIEKDVDIEEVIGWKNGFFVFHSAGIKEIMKQLERWYDVDVRYSTDVSGLTFSGTLSHYDDISSALEKLNYLEKYHFKLEGKTIIVSDNKR